MRETVYSGTSRKSFRGLVRSPKYQHLDIGGKTGTLTGQHPKGKCDWFVGYFDSPNESIAIAALTIHKKYWKVKSATLAKKYIELYEEWRDAAEQQKRVLAKSDK